MVYNHSVKVPTQYKKLAKIFKKSITEKKSVKSLLYEEKHAKVSNALALLSKYSTNKNVIENLINKTKIFAENPRLDEYLGRVLITELIFGTKNLKGESKPVQCILSYKDKFQEELKQTIESDKNNSVTATSNTENIDSIDTASISAGNNNDINLKQVKKPRYVRVNTNLLSIDDFIKQLNEEEWRKSTKICDTYESYLEAIQTLEEDEYLIDIHVECLFIFHPKWKTYWATHQFTNEKKIILQDKGTSLVAELLNPPPNSIVLDMCSAPGIKTIHLSNIMKNNGIIYAIERNPQRYKTLNEMIEKSNAKIVKTMNSDALTLNEIQNENDLKNVEYILVDPSCSGSGIQSRISLENNDEKDRDRLFKLQYLQNKLLNYAMNEFPNVKRIVYSTCSLYLEENERVVQRCLENNPNFKLLSGKKALRRLWKSFGNPDYKGIGKNCVYCRPDKDYTDGIFIAIFEKIKE